MSLANELYQEVILDHNRSPRNFGKLDNADHHAEGYNPLCGDRVRIDLRMAGDEIAEVVFEGQGCAISTASASLMTQALKGRRLEEARGIFESFRRMVRGEEVVEWPDELESLEVFSGLQDYPVRVKCATLAWHTVLAALEDRGESVSTE